MNLRKLTISKMHLVLVALVTTLLIACSDDEKKEIPKPPVTSSVNPEKIEVIVHWGHLHGASFHANPQPKGSPLKRLQTITFQKKGKEWEQIMSTNENAIAKGKPFVFIGGSTTKQVEKNEGGRYAVEIIMYDKKGTRINKQVTDKATRFQTFFSITDLQDIETKKKNNTPMTDVIFGYKYRDTNPENVMLKRGGKAKLSKTNVGFKGYFAVGKPYLSGKLHINLIEWLEKDKAENLPFDTDIKKLKDIVTVFSLVLPIDIPSAHPIDDDASTKHFIVLGKYFGITAQEIEDLEWGDVDPESSKYWM